MIKPWSQVIKELPNAKLCIIGNGEEDYIQKLKKLQKEIGVEQNIDWKGYINGKEKYELYSNSKIYARSTVYGNNDIVAAEALCTGLPVACPLWEKEQAMRKRETLFDSDVFYYIQDFSDQIFLIKKSDFLNPIYKYFHIYK